MADKIIRRRCPTLPGVYIEEYFLGERKISKRKFATDIGDSENFLNHIIDVSEKIAPDLAERIAAVLGTTSKLRLNSQNEVDEWEEMCRCKTSS